MPLAKDRRKSNNFRYMETWVEKLKIFCFIYKFCCSSDLIRFMVKEGEKIMKGSFYEDDFLMVHDALVLMTTNMTITWTRKNNYLH